MPATNPPTHKAKVVEWDRAKGYGFLRFGEGRLFLHRRDFTRCHRAPVVGDVVRFTVGKDVEGRQCAQRAVLLERGLRISIASLFLVVGLTALPVMAALRHGAPLHWIAAYAAAWSGIAYWAYDHDKRRAQGGEWRLSEATLHLLELAGGWPGAFLAQRRLRHKCSKPSFQFVFWLIVLAYQLVAFDLLQTWPYSHRALNRFGVFWRAHQPREVLAVKPADKADIIAEELSHIMLAASQGDVQAQGDLAKVYFEGRLVKPDFVAAYQWGSLAANQPSVNLGASIGKTIRAAAMLKMTTEQITDGDRLVAAFVPQAPSAPKLAVKSLPSGLRLKGISGTPAQRFALINNQTFTRGETANVTLTDRIVGVHCFEIRESSVLINLDDTPTTYELRLN